MSCNIIDQNIGPSLSSNDGQFEIVDSFNVKKSLTNSSSILYDFDQARVFTVNTKKVYPSGDLARHAESKTVFTKTDLGAFNTYSNPNEIKSTFSTMCKKAQDVIDFDPSQSILYKLRSAAFDRKLSIATAFSQNFCITPKPYMG